MHKTIKKILDKAKAERIEEIRNRTKPVDATPMIKLLMETKTKLTREEREQFLKALIKGFRETGYMLIDRAIIEGKLTEKEYKHMSEELGLKPEDLSPILQGYYHNKDAGEDDTPIVVTMPETPIYKNKEMLQKKFEVKIVTPKQAIKLMEEGMTPDEIESIEKEVKQKRKNGIL